MSWEEAKDRTIEAWRSIRESLTDGDVVELLRQINSVTDLCEKAKEQSHGESGRCDFCIAFQQFGGCMGISLRMSECAVDENKEELRRLMDQFVSQLESLQAPDPLDGSPL